MRLISMTDFVLEHKEWRGDILSDACVMYAQFLKQPLTLDMFTGDESLFEGWELKESVVVDKSNENEYFYLFELKDFTVEYMVDVVTLTQYAIKQLGL